jgi:hypothetical protein
LNKYLISPLLLTLFLQGCGGGSSSSPEAPVDPVEYTFSLTAQLTNECGVASAYTDVELLLQDDTWQTLNTYKADDSGVISFVTTSEFINYTLVAKDQQGSEAQGLNVVSFYQASSATPSHYRARFDERLDELNKSCECVTKNLELSHRKFSKQTNVISSSSFSSWEAIDNKTTLLNDVTVCRVLDSDWSPQSFLVLGENSEQQTIAAGDFKKDFSSDVWSLLASEVEETVLLDTPHQAFTTNQIILNQKHFPIVVAEDDTSFPNISEHIFDTENFYQTQASLTFDEVDSVVRSSVITTKSQIISTEAKESFSVKVNEQRPPIDDVRISEIKADGNYDYSGVVGFPMAVISYTFITFEPTTKLLMPAKWTFYGPEKGRLAISAPLKGYGNIIDSSTKKSAIDVQLVKSKMNDNYQDYIKYYQGNSSVDMSNDFVKNIDEVILNIKIN